MLEALSLPFFQRAVVEVILLAAISGLLGTWIVLRGLAFFSHAVGAATVPGLVVADGLAFSPLLGAFGAALLTAGAFALLSRRRAVGTDSATALVLAGALAAGVILASDVFGSQGSVDRLLFGSLLAIGSAELLFAAGVLAAAVVAARLFGPRWLGEGFAGPGPDRGPDVALALLVALSVVAALAAAGALLTAAILVVPAATTRLLVNRVGRWQLLTAALAAVEGVAGLLLAYQLDLPPGPVIAVLAGAVFALTAIARALWSRRPLAAAAAGAAALFLLAGCGPGSEPAEDGRLPVAATTAQVAEIVREVGGSDVAVDQVIRPGAEAHDFEPRPSDVAGVADAKILFTSGAGLDGWAEGLAADAGSQARIVDLFGSLPVRRQAGGAPDPHWWHDPRNLEAAAGVVAGALSRTDPAGRAGFERRARAFGRRARRVDDAISRCLGAIPAERRVIVTDHDALGYFTGRYGIEQAGAIFPATSTQAQASAGEVVALERAIRERRVRVVFPESSLNGALARRIAADTGAREGAPLYADTLGEPGTREATVLGAMEANADAIADGVSGGKVRCRER
ncbi:MAG: hypothetical protein FGM34_08395 [Solirubrobacteraceae bacterium]|nr:hypothetical protein [Solirubrobacteraceae bacterium]